MHRLLMRQLRRHGIQPDKWPAEFAGFINDVNRAYEQNDADRALLERSLDLSSQELLQANDELRRTLKMAHEAIARFEAVIEQTPQVAIQGFDREGRVLQWNHASTRMYGIERHEAIGRRLQDLIMTAEEARRFEATLRTICETKEASTPAEWSLTHPSGRNVWCYSSMFPVFSEGRVAEIICMDVDITARKQAEEDRLRMEQQIQQTQKLESLGVLAGGIAHDFNNLLMAILGNLDLALDDLPPTSMVRTELIEAEKATRRAADLAKQMLAYSGRGHFQIQQVDLRALIREMTHMLEVSVSKKAELRMHFQGDLPMLAADATQMRQIIMNLVINASESLGEKPGVLTVTTEVCACDENFLADCWSGQGLPAGQYVCMRVADTGCGISRDHLSRIFDPFFTTKFTGRGLGLAAVLGIIRGHKGAIKVESQVGQGTEFAVYLPAAGAAALPKSVATTAVAAWRGHGTILLVDDEKPVLNTAKKMIERLGFEVLTAQNGQDALALFRAQHAQLACVLLDLTMPQMDGEETFREMSAVRTDIPVVVSSGFNEQEVLSRFVSDVPVGFIQKPFTLHALSEALRTAIEQAPGS